MNRSIGFAGIPLFIYFKKFNVFWLTFWYFGRLNCAIPLFKKSVFLFCGN